MKDVLDWLLEEDNPSVRYLTLKNIQGKQEDDREVLEAQKALMKEGPVNKILSFQHADGGFLSPSMIKKYGERRAHSGYQPKYKGTTWQAIFLAQLGADKNDGRITKLAGFILDANYNPDYKTFGIYMQHKYNLDFMSPPCFVANMVWSLSTLGFFHDERVQDSLKWLLRYQRFDDGDFKTPGEWPYRGSSDRCFGKHSCFVGVTQSLKAMTAIPPEERSESIRQFTQRAVDYILLHKVYKRSHGASRPVRPEYLSLAFPLTYYDDVPGILESLLFFKVKDRAVDDAVKWLVSWKNDKGRWLLEKTINSSSMYSRFEEKGEESKWITYRVMNVLRGNE